MTSKRVLTGIPMLFVLVTLAACSGGGGGGDAAPAPTPLATGTFTKTVDLGTSLLGDTIPFWTQPYTKSQHLYTSAQIKGSGRITTVRFRRNATLATATTCPNFSVRLGHTNLTALNPTFANNVNTGQGSLTTVINNQSFTIPAGNTGTWIDIPLQAAFDYNGIDNLVVEFEKTSACTQDVFVDAQGSTNIRVWSTVNTPSGTLDFGRNVVQFVFAGGDDEIDLGGVDSNSWPFADTAMGGNDKPRIQNLYLASEINGSGPITGIAFQLNELSVAGSYTYTLKLGHSTLTTLTSTFTSNYSDSPVTVANAVSFTIPAGVPDGDWVWVPIPSGVFTYNGTDNLIVEVATSSGTADTWLRKATIPGRRVYVNDTTGTATTGAVDSTASHIALRFNGGTMDVHTPAGMSSSGFDNFPFFDETGKRQYLYLASELGTKGSIATLACRVGSDAETSAETYSYEVSLGHANATALGTDYAANLSSPITVFNGTLSIPAGLQAGDWLEIPLSVPFAYNGKDNLVVQIAGTGGVASFNRCALDSTTTGLYANRRLFSSSPTDATGTLSNALPDMRFTLQ